MPDKKPIDSEIVKAWECCKSDTALCNECPYDKIGECIEKMCADSIDLINRLQAELDDLKRDDLPRCKDALRRANEMGVDLQAENERLKAKCENTQVGYNFLKADFEETEKRNRDLVRAFQSYKAEAYKEFAEKAKEFMHNKFKALDEYEFEYITERDIDNIVKEMVGDDNA